MSRWRDCEFKKNNKTQETNNKNGKTNISHFIADIIEWCFILKYGCIKWRFKNNLWGVESIKS
jgi:hypothetical protein